MRNVIIDKLTSRKFWLAVVGFIAPLFAAFGYSDNQITQICSIIMSGATVVAYILGEGFIDSKSVNSKD